MNDLLFVYGTLLDDKNKYGAYLIDHSKYFAKASLSARLFDLGDYPGAVIDADAPGKIQGVLRKIDDPETVLGVLDIYEGFGIDQPQPNEFVRVLTEVETVQGAVLSWIYVYNLSLENLPEITGDYFAGLSHDRS